MEYPEGRQGISQPQARFGFMIVRPHECGAQIVYLLQKPTAPFRANDLVVDSEYIYWTSYGWPPSLTSGTTIGRAKLDGTERHENFITGAAAPACLAIQT
jgi:hypothetical protein